MGRTFIRQETQIRNSDDYDDALAAGAALETQGHLQGDLNALRSQLKRAIYDDAAGNWYDDIPTVNAKKRAIKDINTDLDDIEEKRLLYRSQLMTDVSVTAAQNWEVLSVAGSEAPSVAAAVGAGTAEGAVVATLAGDVGSASLNEVGGPDAISPKNLCLVRDATTGDPVTSDNREVYALLQAETGTVDGEAFNDTTKQVQLSFVRINATGDDLEACPVADIAGKTVNYSYIRRVKFDNIPETAFLTGTFIDQVPVAVSVTLNAAIDNQVGAATQTDRDIDWRVTDTYKLRFQTSDGGVNMLAILPNAAGDEIEINIDTLDVNNALDADFLNGATFDSGGTPLRVGVTAGYIDTAAADLGVRAGGELYLDDSNQTGSTWAQVAGIKLSDTTAEWDTFETLYGEASLLSALNQAAYKENRSKTVGVVTAASIAADTNVTGAGAPNIDAQLGNYSAVTFVSDVDVYLNGELLRNGVDATANHDVYPGTTPANGDLKFEFVVKINDVITMIIYGVNA